MRCFVCDEPSPYPVCNECTREGYDINKIIDGSQKPKFDESTYQEFIFKELRTYRVKAKDEAHAHRKVDSSMMIKCELKVQRIVKLEIETKEVSVV